MKAFSIYGLSTLAAVFCISLLSSSVEAKGQNPNQYNQGDVEYNATPNSPTLPLVQYPPPQNYPTSVQIGTPSYYYYYPPMYGPGYGGGYGPGYGGAPSGAGVSFYNAGGPTQRTFYYNTPIPGQMPLNGGWGGGAYGGYNGINGGLYVP